jgi:haloalkane dehalogenase
MTAEAIERNSPVRPGWVDESMYSFQDNWIILDGHCIHYVDEGPRDAPTLLFVHPGAGWSFTYRYHIQQLRNQFRCVALDFPGYGLSEARDGYGYTLLEQAQVLEQFVESLDLRNIVAWGNDGGGPTVILAMADHTDRVSGLVVGGTFGWSIKPYRMVVWPLRLFTGRIMRLVNRYTNLIAWLMGSKTALGTRTLTKAERAQYTAPFKDRDSRNRTLRLYSSFMDSATQDALDRALPSFRHTPVLIQFGDKDPMTAQHWPERWATETPLSRLIILPEVRHFTFEGAPEATVRNFRGWWTDISERSNTHVRLARIP